MIETVQKPDFVFHLPNKVKFTKEQHEQFNKELNRVTKLINASNRTTLLTKLRDEVEGMKPIDVLSMDKYRLTTHGEGHWMLRYQSEVIALLEKEGE